MTSRNIFPGIGLAIPSSCMGPVLDNMSLSDVTVTNLLTANNVNVTGTIVIQNIIESLIIKTDMLEEFTLGAGVTVANSLYLTNPTLMAGFDVYDTSGTILRGQVYLRGTSTAYDAALRMTSGPSGAFIFEGATVPYMTLFNDTGVGKMLIDRIAPNATTAVSIDSLVVGYSTAVIPGGVRYNSNVLEVCNNLGVWGPTFTAGGSIDIVNRVISLAATISATNATLTNLYGDVLLGVTAQSLVISPTSLLLPGAMRYDSGTGGMSFSDGVVWKSINTTAYSGGNSISVSGGGVVSLNGDVFVNSIRALTTPNTTFISLTSADATVAHTPLQYYASARTGDTAQLIFGQGSGAFGAAVIKHNYVGLADPTNSVRLGVLTMEDIFIGYGGGYSSIRQPTIIGAGTTIAGNLGFGAGNLSVYTGTARKNVALIDPTSSAVISNGILATSNTVYFYPTNVTATDTRYIFSNILGGVGGQAFSIDPWSTDSTIYVSTDTSKFVYRARINNVDATPWASSAGTNGVSGVTHDYVVIGQTLATTPIKGSFATDTSGHAKIYNGAAWKFLVPMDGTTKIAECDGMASATNPVKFYPTSLTAIDNSFVFSNINPGTGSESFVIDPWASNSTVYLTSNSDSFQYRARVGIVDATIVIESAGVACVNGVRHHLMLVGQDLPTTPLLGSFATDASGYMKMHTGAAWKFLVPMDGSTKMAECNGLMTAANPTLFYPTSVTGLDMDYAFHNIAGGSTKKYTIGVWESTDMTYLTTDTSNFVCRAKINNTAALGWASSVGANGVSGVQHDFMVVGSTLANTPVLGSFATDVATLSMKYHTGTAWRYLTSMDTSSILSANGIVSTANPVIFYPTSLVAIDNSFTFSNINPPGLGGETFSINPFTTDHRIYVTTDSNNFSYRGKINNTDALTWASTAGTTGNSGVLFDYMVIGQALATTPILGSFTTDLATTSLKFHTGAAWKYIVHMDTTTKLAEADGIVGSASSMIFQPTSLTASNRTFIFRNTNGGGDESYNIAVMDTTSRVLMTTYATRFSYRGSVNGAIETTWASSSGNDGVNGVLFDYMHIGQNIVSAPLLGSFATDSAGYMKYYNGTAWKYLAPMNITSKLAEVDGIKATNNNVYFYPSNALATDTRYLFSNISGGSGGQLFVVEPWAFDDTVYVSLYATNFVYRAKINDLDATNFIMSAGAGGVNGVTYDYMAVGASLATTPILGSFANDAGGFLKFYNGAAWKFLTPMDTSTQKAEMKGIVVTDPASFVVNPASAVDVDTTITFSNSSTAGSEGFEMYMTSLSNYISMRTLKPMALYNHTIDGTAHTPWVQVDNDGAKMQHMIIGTNINTTPVAGSTIYTGSALKIHNGTTLDTYAKLTDIPTIHYNVYATVSCGIVDGSPSHTMQFSTGGAVFMYPTNAGVFGVDWPALPAPYAYYFTVTIQKMAFQTQANLRFRVVQGGYYTQVYPSIDGADTTFALITPGQIIVSVLGSVYST